MTLVKVLFAKYNASGSIVGASGQLSFTPTHSQIVSGAPDRVVLPLPFTIQLKDGEANIPLAPTTLDWIWKIDIYPVGMPASTKYVTVPDVAEIDYLDLVEVDPETFAPTPTVPDPAWYAHTDTLALQATSAAISAKASADSIVPARDAADASRAAAAVSETNAALSALSASTSAQSAAQSRTNAAASAAAALASQTAAATSATSAASSASTASTKAAEAATSATNAQTSATASAASAATSTTQAGIATQKASDSGTSAFNAGQSASVAWGHANDSADSATASQASAASAATKATESAASAASVAAIATASQTARTGAETARTGAETARTGAETAKTLSETAKDASVAAANGFSIGTITTGAPGATASATITGAAPSRLLNLGIPQGPVGPATSLTVIGTTTGPDLSGPQGLKGDPGNPTAFELRGAVPPNGVITASPGTYYTDTAGTNGAWRWLKTSGTGNTGWSVSTGYLKRNVLTAFQAIDSGLTANAGFPPPTIIRTPTSIHYMIGVTKGLTDNSLDYSAAFGVSDAGWRPSPNINWQIATSISGSGAVIHYAPGVYIRQWGTTSGASLNWVMVMTFPADPATWPTTLPGIAG